MNEASGAWHSETVERARSNPPSAGHGARSPRAWSQPTRRIALPAHAAFADHNERRPRGRMGEALGALVDHCEHGAAQSLGTTDLGRDFQLFKCSLDQSDGRMAVNVPMRDEQGTGPGIEECPRQPG